MATGAFLRALASGDAANGDFVRAARRDTGSEMTRKTRSPFTGGDTKKKTRKKNNRSTQ